MTRNAPKLLSALLTTLMISMPSYAGPDQPTQFSNSGGIINTRHNMTQSTATGNVSASMDESRNNYAQVCVYCHTPHGANQTVDAPLWNRTMPGSSYTTYDTLGTSSITSDFLQPGVSSLTCLSCHDGTLGIDSIINMPGSGGYNGNLQQSSDKETVDTFLDTWATDFGGETNTHASLNPDFNSVDNVSCLGCHNNTTGVGQGLFVEATDFTVFAIGTDLTNDHPVGVQLPNNGSGTDFNSPTAVRASIQWFDNDGDSRPDSDEIRFYDTGNGPRVECASCHDPHGVAPGGFGTTINKSFLRIDNDGSAVCLTCHVK